MGDGIICCFCNTSSSGTLSRSNAGLTASSSKSNATTVTVVTVTVVAKAVVQLQHKVENWQDTWAVCKRIWTNHLTTASAGVSPLQRRVSTVPFQTTEEPSASISKVWLRTAARVEFLWPAQGTTSTTTLPVPAAASPSEPCQDKGPHPDFAPEPKRKLLRERIARYNSVS